MEFGRLDVPCECVDGQCRTPCEGSACPCEGSDCCFERVRTLKDAWGNVAAVAEGARLEGVFGGRLENVFQGRWSGLFGGPLMSMSDFLDREGRPVSLEQSGGSVEYARFRDGRFAVFEAADNLTVYRRSGSDWIPFMTGMQGLHSEPVAPRFRAITRASDLRLYFVADRSRSIVQRTCVSDAPESSCDEESDFSQEASSFFEDYVRVLDVRPDPTEGAEDWVLASTDTSLAIAVEVLRGESQWTTELAHGASAGAFASATESEPRLFFTGVEEGTLWEADARTMGSEMRVAEDVAPAPSAIAATFFGGRQYVAYPVVRGEHRSTRVRAEDAGAWRVLTDLDNAPAEGLGTLPQFHVVDGALYIITADGGDAGVHRLNAEACFDGE
ncbi:MAG: hypothetical protein AAF645_06580 [Myxococcota bacterium]